MSTWPFRFVHAADLHLELPPGGVDHVPEHLRLLFLDAAHSAAQRVFETVLTEDADFVILSGDILDPEIYEQDSILGDFLREARRYQMNAGEPIDLDQYLAEPNLAGAIAPALAITDRSLREHVLREAAVLGIDLLSGEEPQP